MIVEGTKIPRRLLTQEESSALLIGAFDPTDGNLTNGIVHDLSEVTKRLKWTTIVDTWALRIILGILIAHIFGIDHITDLRHLFGI